MKKLLLLLAVIAAGCSSDDSPGKTVEVLNYTFNSYNFNPDLGYQMEFFLEVKNHADKNKVGNIVFKVSDDTGGAVYQYIPISLEPKEIKNIEYRGTLWHEDRDLNITSVKFEEAQ